MKTHARNALVGFFFLVAIVLFVVISVILSGAQQAFEATTTYRVRFDLRPGAAGLSEGAPVNLGGLRVGRVSGLRIASDDLGRPQAIEAEIKIRAGILLYEDADVQLKSPLLGAAAVIDIVGVGSPRDERAANGETSIEIQGESGVLEAGEIVQGRIAPPQLLEHAGFGPEQAEEVRQTIADARSVMNRLDVILAEIEPASGEITENVRLASLDLRGIISQVRSQLDRWTHDATEILATANDTSLTIQRTATAFESQTETTRVLLDSLRDMLDTNRPRIDRILANVDESLIDIRENVLPQLAEAAADGRTGAEDLAATADQLRTLVAEEAPGIRRTVSSARLAADQLAHATTEIRRSPWRLLQRPQTRELESELIYNAAGMLAAAASDLRDASAALQNLPAGASPEDVQRLTKQVQEALQSYRDAEAELMERFAEGR